MASELTTTITAEIERGASVCSATHSGSPLESIAQHSASTPISAASVTYGRSLDHAQPAARAARAARRAARSATSAA